MMILSLAAIPLVLLLRRAARAVRGRPRHGDGMSRLACVSLRSVDSHSQAY
jgi:hypothetical protein